MVYEITFDVATPVIATMEIHLDSILYAVSPAAHNKDKQINRFTLQSDVKDLPIPVDCIKRKSQFVYCCSTADFINPHKITDNATKRRDGYDYMYYHRQQTPRKGYDKDCMLKLYGVACESVKFLASSSNIADLHRYLRRVKSIGGMRKQGYGEVTGYTVDERPEMDWRDCVCQRGFAIRNIPSYFLETQYKNISRCRPPYWLLDRTENCAVPGDRIILKDDVYLSEFRR